MAVATPDISAADLKEFGRLELLRGFLKQPLPLVGIVVILGWTIVAIAAPLVSPEQPNAQSSLIYHGPSSAHWFGTDQLGRDVLSRVVWGTRISLPTAVVVVLLALVIGGSLGAIAGYWGRWIDELIMRFADLIFAFPTIILALAVTAALGPGLRNAVIAVVIVSWPAYARVVRGLILSLRESEYISASRLLGASSLRALVVEILPNISGPVLVMATLDLAAKVLLLAALSFLGLGVQAPTAEWGAMVASGAQQFQLWWLATFPGLAIFTVVLGFNLVGDALRDALDPRTRLNN